MPKNFKREPHSTKWFGHDQDPDYHCMTMGDLDFPLYDPFLEHLVKKTSQINNLTYKERSDEYFDSIFNWYRKYHAKPGLELKKQLMVQAPSIINLMCCAILAFTNEGDHVLVFTPIYNVYLNIIVGLKRKVLAVEMIETPVKDSKNEIYWEFSEERYRKAIQEFKPKLILFGNPHNPTGKIFTKQQQDIMIDQCQKTNPECVIVSDQILCDLSVWRKRPTPLKKFHTMLNYTYPNLLVGNSISKAFNCESLQGGYGIAKSDKIAKQYNDMGIGVLKLTTNQSALIMTPRVYTQDGEDFIKSIIPVIEGNYIQLQTKLEPYADFVKVYVLEASFVTGLEFFPEGWNNTLKEKGEDEEFYEYVRKSMLSYKIELTEMRNYFYPKSTKTLFRVNCAAESQHFTSFMNSFVKSIEHMIKECTK